MFPERYKEVDRMPKFTMSVSDEMKKVLESERKKRKLDSVQETIRSILGEYFKEKEAP